MPWIFYHRLSRLILSTLAATGCHGATVEQPTTITLATSTSTRDSGLLDYLLPRFQAETNIRVKVIAVGTGQALELGRRGDADVLLTHAPAAEDQFMAAGHGLERRAVMMNDFVLLGPTNDLAQVADSPTILEALRKIARGQASFVSRGDQSGTHLKELKLWKETALEPAGQWYLESGTGMAATLRLANEKQAYMLCDRGTFLAQRDGLNLAILFEDDRRLLNPYSVMLVYSDSQSGVQQQAARQFLDFLIAPNTQQMIGQFGVSKFGQPLFFPAEQVLNLK